MNLRLALLLCATATASAAEPAITIYNNDFAVVRETIPFDLKAGVNHVAFGGATSHLEPDSVVLRDLSGKTQLQILEQAYRSDAISQSLLLSLYEGKTLDFVVRDQNGSEHVLRGEVVRSGYIPGGRSEDPIIRVDGKLRFEMPGLPLFPALSDDTILKPTLTWDLASAAPAQVQAELGYVTGGFSWSAAYNLVAEETGDKADVLGWVTLRNDSGTTFREATLKLMAGDVRHEAPSHREMIDGFKAATVGGALSFGAAVTEKAFDDFHLYTLPRPVTLRNGEMKQVEFMGAQGVEAKTVYLFDAARTGSWLSGEQKVKIQVTRELRNSEANHLGLPFPAGRVRIYRRDAADGRLEFVGEDRIDHTAKDEMIRIHTGDAFDLVGTRKQTATSIPYANERRETYEITLKNHKKAPVEIRVVEHVGSWVNWEISDNTHPFEKADAGTIEFKVPVAPDETQVVRYTVTYSVP